MPSPYLFIFFGVFLSVFGTLGAQRGIYFFQIVKPTHLKYTYEIRLARDFGRDFARLHQSVRLERAEPAQSCSPLSNADQLFGAIVLVERGGCSFLSKTLTVEAAGGLAVMVTDSEKGEDLMVEMIKDETGRTASIPAVYLPGNHGLIRWSEMNSDSLLEKAKSSKDEFAAETWMLVAKAVGKSSYENTAASFEIYCSKNRIQDAADCFQKLYMGYGSDPRFWKQVKLLIQALKQPSDNDNVKLKKEMFSCLHPQIQQSLLLDYAEKQTEVADKSDAYLILLRSHPSTIAAFGIEFARILREQKETVSDPVPPPAHNWCWQVLVCRVIPPLLKCKDLPVSEPLCTGLIKESLQFFASYANTPKREEVDKCLDGADPWGILLDILKSAGSRLGWKRLKLLTELKLGAVEYGLKSMEKEKGSEERELERAFIALAFLASLTQEYCRKLEQPNRLGETQKKALVVLPSLKREKCSESVSAEIKSPKRRKRQEADSSKLSFRSDHSAPISTILTLGSSCYNILQKHHEAVMEEVMGNDSGSKTRSLLIDSLIQSRKPDSALKFLTARTNHLSGDNHGSDIPQEHSDRRMLKAEASLQIASCHYLLGSVKEACGAAMDGVTSWGEASGSSEKTSPDPLSFDADTALLAYIPPNQFLEYSIGVASVFLTPPALSSTSQPTEGEDHKIEISNSRIAHLLVLTQLDTTCKPETLRDLIKLIVDRGSFSYPNFADFINNIDILEEFAFLNATQTKLDLSISDSDANRKKGASTRRSTKEIRDETKQLLEQKVMSLKGESQRSLALRFFRTEREAILSNLC